jgi:septum site-determining protein MinC
MRRHLAVQFRSLSSSSDKYRSYLETWVGSKPTTLKSEKSCPQSSTSSTNADIDNAASQGKEQRQQQYIQQHASSTASSTCLAANVTSALILKGTSYLLPTLRLERSEDAESLRQKIQDLLASVRLTGVASMLRGMPTESSTESIYTWYAPIVLDLSALTTDGSHHYKPPEVGRLVGAVNVLREFGIVVVGVRNVPSVLESEAIQTLGLPLFQPKVGGGGSILRSTSTIPLEDALNLVWRKRVHSIPDVLDFTNPTMDNENMKSTEQNNMPHNPTFVESKDKVNNSETSSSTTILISLETTKPNMEVRDNLDMSAQTSEQPLEQSQKILSSMPPPSSNAFVYYGSVRSGQQVAAEQGQALIVIGSVNSGGEVLSHGDIYVFGKLRGRALAGLTYPKDAKIIATSFDPELICIGDTFTTVDTVQELGLKGPEVSAMVTLSELGDLVVQEITL